MPMMRGDDPLLDTLKTHAMASSGSSATANAASSASRSGGIPAGHSISSGSFSVEKEGGTASLASCGTGASSCVVVA
eukprot:6175649-Pleurochrysis_carterae.AAC.1